MNDEYGYQDIEEHYVYDGKDKRTTVKFFPDNSIATITTTVERDGTLTTEILKNGMSFEEIKRYFPPLREGEGDYNRAMLIRSIIYEAFIKEGEGLEEGNVRNFWYTHLKQIITRILGESENNSVETAIAIAWGEMINSGLVTYEGMNVIGGKESMRISVVKDSPFNNLIVAVEKEDYFNYFKWIPRLFNCTLITAGGAPSRAVARAFIKQLSDMDVDLNLMFYMCVASDLDPAGFYIQEAFRKQLEAAIQFYGGLGKVDIKRLFVRKDQVTKELLEAEAIPCKDKNTTDTARKAENTKWEYFKQQTEGGLYIPVSDNWAGPVEIIEGERKVRALLEMNAFSKKTIEAAIIRELLKIIEETNDESKILIPEIMRVFELMREDVSEDVYKDWHKRLIQPEINKFLEATDGWSADIEERYNNESEEAEEQKDEEEAPIDEKYDNQIEEKKEEVKEKIKTKNEEADAVIERKENEARERVPELYEYREYLNWQIRELTNEREEVEENIGVQCADIIESINEINEVRNEEIEQWEKEREEQIETWEGEREEALQPIKDAYDEETDDIEKRRKYREDKLEKFKEDHAAVFNPVEMLLKNTIMNKLASLTGNIYFKKFETMERFQPYLAERLTTPNLLLDEGITCFDHPTPAFTETDLLTKAAAESHENIGGVRKAFPRAFMDEMRDCIKELAGREQFELKGEVPTADLSEEVNQSMQDTEDEIDEGMYGEAEQ